MGAWERSLQRVLVVVPIGMTDRSLALLDDSEAAATRAASLEADHVRPIEAWRERLLVGGRRVPHVDPLDGGANARLLLLLETPGPGRAPVRFVSRDNPTGTARNLRRFLDEARIARADMLLWNTVPWIVHAPGARNRALRRGEIAEGLSLLPPLLDLLPRLEVVVLAGRIAAEAAPVIHAHRPEVAVLTMPHPSPTYVCTDPAIVRRIGEALRKAGERLRGRDVS